MKLISETLMATMKIFLTGSSGLLGSEILIELNNSKKYQVETLNYKNILKSNETDLKNMLSDKQWIIHCAAQTNVEDCEINQESCYKNICHLTEKIISCSKKTTRFIYISSTGVYGNYQNSPYTEFDETSPTTMHHRSKKIAEDMILKHSSKNIVIRTGWLYGNLKKNDFVSKIIKVAKKKPSKIESNTEQYGCPTNANQLALKCIELIQNEAYGIFNIVNSGKASRYDYVKNIIDYLNYGIEVVPVKSSFFKRVANVSDNETAISERLKKFDIQALPNWKDSLINFLNHNV